jgi:hypothetical protein
MPSDPQVRRRKRKIDALQKQGLPTAHLLHRANMSLTSSSTTVSERERRGEIKEQSQARISRTIERSADGSSRTQETEMKLTNRNETYVERERILSTCIENLEQREEHRLSKFLSIEEARQEVKLQCLAFSRGDNTPQNGLFQHLDKPLSLALDLHEVEWKKVNLAEYTPTKRLFNHAQEAIEKVRAYKLSCAAAYGRIPPKAREMAEQFKTKEGAFDQYREEYSREFINQLKKAKGKLVKPGCNGDAQLPSPDTIAYAMTIQPVTQPRHPYSVLGGYTKEEMVEKGRISPGEVDALLELRPPPRNTAEKPETTEERWDLEEEDFDTDSSSDPEEDEYWDVEVREGPDRYSTLRLAAASIHVFTQLWKAKGETPDECKDWILISVLSVTENVSPVAPTKPCFLDKIPGVGGAWLRPFNNPMLSKQPWVLADVQLPCSKIIQLELPIAQMRVLFPPGGDNSLVFQASTTRYIMACAQTVVQWQPDEPTAEIDVIGRHSILFPTRWLQRTVSGELMKDHADNLIPLLEFKPYFQELMHQKASHESEHQRQGAADEIHSLQADLADMSQMLSRN